MIDCICPHCKVELEIAVEDFHKNKERKCPCCNNTFLVNPKISEESSGVPLSETINQVNKSKSKTVILIISAISLSFIVILILFSGSSILIGSDPKSNNQTNDYQLVSENENNLALIKSSMKLKPRSFYASPIMDRAKIFNGLLEISGVIKKYYYIRPLEDNDAFVQLDKDLDNLIIEMGEVKIYGVSSEFMKAHKKYNTAWIEFHNIFSQHPYINSIGINNKTLIATIFGNSPVTYVKKPDTEFNKWIRKVGIAKVDILSTYQKLISIAQENGVEAYYKSDLYYLGLNYYYGIWSEENKREAFNKFKESAKKGDADAQHSLGYCYHRGEGVTKNYKEAFKWYRKGAEQGHARAQNNLAYCYQYGEGVTKDYAEAFRWYKKSAEQGDLTGESNLGYCYENGYGVAKDFEEAFEWYRSSTRLRSYYGLPRGYKYGNLYAQYKLGVSCENRGAVKEAVRWYLKAASQGHTGAQNGLKRLSHILNEMEDHEK